MKFSLVISYIQPGELIEIAQAAERAGFHALAMGDHPVHPVDVAPTYPYGDAKGTSSVQAHTPQLDPWVTAGVIAAATERLRFLTSVYLLLFRHPLVTAKAAATFQGASNGRLLFGTGLGWMPEEFACMGVPYAQRGKRFEEALDILEAMWAGGEVEHHGELYDFPAIGTNPTPTAPIPLYFGGHSERMMDRAARRGDGWICAPKLETMAQQIATVRERREAHGRADRPFEFVGMCHRAERSVVEQLASLGIEHLIVRSPWRPDLPTGPPVEGHKPDLVEEMGAQLADLVAA
jgi:probable F420-dependent oxidoreductase